MKEKLRTLFQQKFNPIEYRKVVLENLLHAQQLLSQPQFLEETNDGDRIYGLGYLTDADGKQIGLYYTDVVNSDVRRKRVGFRQMMKSYVKYGADAAIAVFADKEHWRLSYMSDLKGGETSAKRFSYILGDPNGQYNTPVNRLLQLGTQAPRLRLNDIFEAFSVETLSDEFFDLYRDHYADIVEYLTGKRMVKVDNKWVEKVIHAPLQSVYEQLTGVENADKIVRDYVKKMMGRIVFLHFLQKKGWLNDDANFMQHTFSRNESCQDDFLEKILEPLFFGFLNTRKEDRAKLFDKHPNWDKSLLSVWENIPYLNGGLFEQDEVDNLNIRLPRSMFDDLFTFLAEYNFTVDENDPDDAEVGVDPEMLGKIFESLLEDNKAKGAFYTPKEIVRYMCKESLIAYLSSRISESPCPAGRNLVNLINTSDSVWNDNRVSSTAESGNNLQDSQDFASETSRSIRRFVEQHEMQPELEPYRDILDAALRNVKICDPAIGSGAFPMGLLNELWRCREALVIREANNLQDLQDFVSAASRSKLKKEIIENNIYGVDIERGAIDIARLRFWLSIVVDAEEPEPLPNFDYKFMQGNSLIESYKGIDLSRISNRLRGGQSKSTQLLLGLDSDFSKKNLQRLMRDYFSVTDHKQKASMRQAINDEVKRLITDFIGGTTADLNKLDPSANQDFFLWHTWFKDIFDNGGFDIVVANPPYVLVSSDDLIAPIYRAKYKTANEGKVNLYKLFYEFGLSILKDGGTLSYITPNTYLTNKDSSVLRNMFFTQTALQEIIEYTEKDKVFENVTQAVTTNVLQKRKPLYDDTVSVRTYKHGQSICNQSDLKKAGAILPINSVINHMNSFPDRLSDWFSIYQGEINLTAKRHLFSADKGNNRLPMWRGNNVGKYCCQSIPIEWCETSGSKPSLYNHERIVMQQVSNQNQPFRTKAFLSSKGFICGNSTNGLSPVKPNVNLQYYIGLINSKTFNYYFDYFSFTNHITAAELKSIPIPNATSEQQNRIASLVENIQDAKRNNIEADTSRLEFEIDNLVYQLYNLTPEEIAIIEK